MTVATLVAYLAVGVSAGILSGIFGIGGGLVIVPILVLAFGMPQQTANGTSLVALLGPVGLMGVLRYYQTGKITAIHIQTGLLIALGMFAGTYFGARFATMVSGDSLRRSFCVFMVLVAIRMWFK